MLNTMLLALALAQGAQDTAYFQQGVDYRIEATLNEPTNVLNGRLRLRYTNNSPRMLDTLWFHLELNAFRPNSRWAQRELQFPGPNQRRFTDIGPDDYAYERIRTATIAGRPVTAVYPISPDSSVVGFPLVQPLEPGATVEVRIDWDSRLSKAPITRRQGRRDRHYDFAQWYPRIAVYDREGWEVRPLLPQGEFYGEFGSFDVTLDLAADQVVAATGVPVEGDPGWAKAAAKKGLEPDYQRTYYPVRASESLGLLRNAAVRGRKHVRWRAEHVHHFAWSTSADYIYEEGAFEDVKIRVFYQPSDTGPTNSWRDVAVERTGIMLAWYDTVFGDFPYPQISNVHRVENGGTEFPMMMMNGTSGNGQGLILHEGGHNYVGEVFGNNEWKEGWLDEGFASFLSSWWVEVNAPPGPSGARVNPWINGQTGMRRLERAGGSQPIDWPSADFKDFNTYNAMTYSKPELMYVMLRDVMGEDDFRQGLRHYFDVNKLRHVREEDFQAAMERFHTERLDWFFHQWLHTTDTLDYQVGEISTRQQGSEWVSRIEIIREGEIWMPVTLQVGDTRLRIDSKDRRHVYFVRTPTRPSKVIIDPDSRLLDMEPANNTKDF
jgi:hypothetical protein